MDWTAKWVTVWLTEWLNYWLIDWTAKWLTDWLTDRLTNSVSQRCSAEASSFSATKNPPPQFSDSLPFTRTRRCFLSWVRWIQLTTFRTIFKFHFNIIFPSRPRPSKWSVSFRFPTKTLHAFLVSPTHATCPTHLIFLDLITQTISNEQHRTLSSSLCSFLHSPVTSSVLDPQMSLCTVFPNTVPLMWQTEFHTHTNEQTNIQFCLKHRAVRQ
jgi:hypothetical protein